MVWILLTGYWNDAGLWDDGDVWRDGPDSANSATGAFGSGAVQAVVRRISRVL